MNFGQKTFFKQSFVQYLTTKGILNPTIQNLLKSGPFEGWISYGPVFKWSGFSYGYTVRARIQNIRILNPFENRIYAVLVLLTV